MDGLGLQRSERLQQALRVDDSQLIERDEAGAILKPASWTPPIRTSTGARRGGALLLRAHDEAFGKEVE